MNTKRSKISIKGILLIQAVMVIYTLSSVCAKMCGSNTVSVNIFGLEIMGLSKTGYLWLACELLCLGIYALIWQQIIKHYDLSVVYANRAFSIFWPFLWSWLFFKEMIRISSIVGLLLVFFGIKVVNSDDK